jgi:hypothetical protein
MPPLHNGFWQVHIAVSKINRPSNILHTAWLFIAVMPVGDIIRVLIEPTLKISANALCIILLAVSYVHFSSGQRAESNLTQHIGLI